MTTHALLALRLENGSGLMQETDVDTMFTHAGETIASGVEGETEFRRRSWEGESAAGSATLFGTSSGSDGTGGTGEYNTIRVGNEGNIGEEEGIDESAKTMSQPGVQSIAGIEERPMPVFSTAPSTVTLSHLTITPVSTQNSSSTTLTYAVSAAAAPQHPETLDDAHSVHSETLEDAIAHAIGLRSLQESFDITDTHSKALLFSTQPLEAQQTPTAVACHAPALDAACDLQEFPLAGPSFRPSLSSSQARENAPASASTHSAPPGTAALDTATPLLVPFLSPTRDNVASVGAGPPKCTSASAGRPSDELREDDPAVKPDDHPENRMVGVDNSCVVMDAKEIVPPGQPHISPQTDLGVTISNRVSESIVEDSSLQGSDPHESCTPQCPSHAFNDPSLVEAGASGHRVSPPCPAIPPGEPLARMSSCQDDGLLSQGKQRPRGIG